MSFHGVFEGIALGTQVSHRVTSVRVRECVRVRAHPCACACVCVRRCAGCVIARARMCDGVHVCACAFVCICACIGVRVCACACCTVAASRACGTCEECSLAWAGRPLTRRAHRHAVRPDVVRWGRCSSLYAAGLGGRHAEQRRALGLHLNRCAWASRGLCARHLASAPPPPLPPFRSAPSQPVRVREYSARPGAAL